MNQPVPSLLNRLQLAFKVLLDASFAARLQAPEATPVATSPAPEAPAPSRDIHSTDPAAALQLLGLLQQEARFVDFIEEDVTQFSDAEIGAAARVVHEGSRKVLHQHFSFAPVREENEDSRLTLAADFDASAIRLTGNVVGQPPFTGTLIHRGWRVTEVKLPKVVDGHELNVIAAAEVEL